jgi:hypothetical protein
VTYVRDLRGVIEREKSSNRGSHNAESTNVRNEKRSCKCSFCLFHGLHEDRYQKIQILTRRNYLRKKLEYSTFVSSEEDMAFFAAKKADVKKNSQTNDTPLMIFT